MSRKRNVFIWVGLAIVIAAVGSYIPLFTLFPSTRDVPWANYLLFLIGGVFIALGLRRAIRSPEVYRGKLAGSIVAVLSVLLCGLFLGIILYGGKQIPSAASALRVGQTAPSFTLEDTAQKLVSSASLLKQHRGLLLIFYRGYW